MNKTDRNSIHRRGKLLVALFASAASLAGGTQAIAPSTAGAVVAECDISTPTMDWIACHNESVLGGHDPLAAQTGSGDPFTSDGGFGGTGTLGELNPDRSRKNQIASEEAWDAKTYCLSLAENIQLYGQVQGRGLADADAVADQILLGLQIYETESCASRLGNSAPDLTAKPASLTRPTAAPKAQHRAAKVKKHRRHGH